MTAELDLAAIDRERSGSARPTCWPTGRRPRRGGCTTSRCSAPTSSGPSSSTRRYWSSHSPRSSRTGTTRARTTSSSTSATGTCSPSSTCPVSTWAVCRGAGGLHHLAISVEPATWERLKGNLAAAGVEYLEESGTSIYSGPRWRTDRASSPTRWERCTAPRCCEPGAARRVPPRSGLPGDRAGQNGMEMNGEE